MARTLPGGARLRLEQALAQWPHWQVEPALRSRPEPVRVLGPGLSNHSVLTRADGQYFVVRVDGVQPERHGISRQGEWRALQLASARGLAPAPRYYNPELGVLVCDYLSPAVDSSDGVDQLGALLRAIHSLPALHHRLDLAERIARYRHQCRERAPAALVGVAPVEALVEQSLGRERADRSGLVLCHNDLLAANRVISGGHLRALDWEYCAMGNRWFDLAVITRGDRLDGRAREKLVQAYLQRAPSADELAALARQELLYAYLEVLWYAATLTDCEAWRQRLPALLEACRSASHENY